MKERSQSGDKSPLAGSHGELKAEDVLALHERRTSTRDATVIPSTPGDPIDAAATLAKVRAAMFGDAASPKIGRFSLLDAVGRGGMGVVHAAYDPQLDRRIALKMQPGEPSPKKRERALAEARTLARLQHPNVVTIHEVGIHEDAVFLAMAFVEGETLDRWVARAKPTAAEVWDALAQAAEGLHAAHRVGLVHGDVKPRNLLRTPQGRVVLVDFGVARDTGEVDGDGDEPPTQSALRLGTPTGDLSGSAASQLGSGPDATRAERRRFGGTPGYAAPEQSAGTKLCAASDQYALAVTAWELLTGQRPDQSHGNPNLPPRVLRALRRALRTSPDDRFEDVRDFVAAARPRDHRRPVMWTLGGATAAGLLLWSGMRGGQPTTVAAVDPCTQIEANTPALFDAELQAKREALVGQEGPNGERWRVFGERLDRAHARLRERREEVCVDGASGRISVATQQAFDGCLSDAEKVVRDLAERFDGASVPDERPDAAALDRLIEVEMCSLERESLVRERAEAGLPRVGSDSELIILAENTVHQWARGEGDEARKNAQALRRGAERSADPWAKAAAERALGLSAKDPEEVEVHLWKAFEIAMEARIDHLALLAATDLADRLNNALDRPREARRVMWTARAWAKSIMQGNPSKNLRDALAPYLGRVENLLGIYASDAGELDVALEHYEAAVAFWEDETMLRPGRPAGGYNNMAELSLQLGDLKGALEYYEHAISILETHAPKHVWIREIKINRAAALLDHGLTAQAQVDLDATEDPEAGPHIIRSEILAVAAWDRGEFETSLRHWEETEAAHAARVEPEWLMHRVKIVASRARLFDAPARALDQLPIVEMRDGNAFPEAKAAALIVAVEVALEHGDAARARRYLDWADEALRQSVGPAKDVRRWIQLDRARIELLEGLPNARGAVAAAAEAIRRDLPEHERLKREAAFASIEAGLPSPSEAKAAAQSWLRAGENGEPRTLDPSAERRLRAVLAR